jgi:hypothetical protein
MFVNERRRIAAGILACDPIGGAPGPPRGARRSSSPAGIIRRRGVSAVKVAVFHSRDIRRCAAVAAACAGTLALWPSAGEAGLAVVIGGPGRVRPGERLVYSVDFRHAYDPRPLNGIAPGDHVSITLFPPACAQSCVVRRLSRGVFVPRSGRMHFRFRFPREYTVCSAAEYGPGTACRRERWRSSDRGILQVIVHGFSPRCPSGVCRRSGSRNIVVR